MMCLASVHIVLSKWSVRVVDMAGLFREACICWTLQLVSRKRSEAWMTNTDRTVAWIMSKQCRNRNGK